MNERTSENHAETVRDSLSRNVLVDVAARVGYLLSRFFIPPFVLAHVSLAAYGLWSTAFIVVSYIGISTLGISNVYVKYIAEYSARREYQKANRLLSTGLLVTTPVCLLVFLFLWMAWPSVTNWLHIEPALQKDAKEVVLAVTAIFLASISLSAFRDVLAGVQQTAWVQYVWITGYLLEAALIFFLVGIGRGIRGLAEAFLIRTLVEIGLQVVVTFRKLPWLRISPALFSRESLKDSSLIRRNRSTAKPDCNLPELGRTRGSGAFGRLVGDRLAGHRQEASVDGSLAPERFCFVAGARGCDLNWTHSRPTPS